MGWQIRSPVGPHPSEHDKIPRKRRRREYNVSQGHLAPQDAEILRCDWSIYLMAAVDQRRHNKSKMVSSRELDNLAGKATTETGYPQSMVSSDSEADKKRKESYNAYRLSRLPRATITLGLSASSLSKIGMIVSPAGLNVVDSSQLPYQRRNPIFFYFSLFWEVVTRRRPSPSLEGKTSQRLPTSATGRRQAWSPH